MTNTAPGPLDTFLISLPDGWQEVELEPEKAAAALHSQIPHGIDAQGALDARRAILCLRRMLEGVRRSGLCWAAAYVEPAQGEAEPGGDLDRGDSDDGDFTLAAFVALTTQSADALGVDTVDFGSLEEAVRGASERAEGWLEEPSLVQFSLGSSIREMLLGEDKDGNRVLEVRYHSLIGQGEGLAVLMFLTPNVELKDEMLELFEAIANTLEFVAA